MQRLDAWESLRQEVCLFLPELCKQVNVLRTTHSFEVDASSVIIGPELLRSRTRARKRRRKRAWGAAWTYLLRLFLVYGTLVLLVHATLLIRSLS
jgi:hypothetical protein